MMVPDQKPEMTRNEYELVWRSSLDSEINYDRLALVLALVVHSRMSVEDVFRYLESQVDDNLIHPTMPIRIHGRLKSEFDIARLSLRLRAETTDQCIRVKFKEAHNLSWSAGLFDRNIFVLGIVTTVDSGVVVTAGALMF